MSIDTARRQLLSKLSKLVIRKYTNLHPTTLKGASDGAPAWSSRTQNAVHSQGDISTLWKQRCGAFNLAERSQRTQSATKRAMSTSSSASTVAESSSTGSGGGTGFKLSWPFVGVGGAFAAGVIAALGTIAVKDKARELSASEAEGAGHFTNWSGTHEVRPKRLYEPETAEELESVVATAHQKGERLRCVGQALSPNGIAFSEEGMVSLALLDKVLDIDPASGRVKVEAGARVQEVVEALRPHGLTLQNFASIREQSIGGYTQVSAHGTGARIPTVDEQVVAMKLVTPARGTLELSEASDPELFRLARVGLGLLGVVSQVTLQCYPAHTLLEHTFVASLKEVRKNHNKWLRQHQHIKYLWIPYTDAIVVVTNDPVPEGTQPRQGKADHLSEAERTAPFRELLLERLGGQPPPPDVAELNGPQLRDRLLEVAPMDVEWVKRVNQAEAEFWRRNEGYRLGASDQLLGFDCGGQQWVLESCFPTGTLRRPTGADLNFMDEMLRILEQNQIPAPAPIEQRWSASSTADMSPASSPRHPDVVHSWVGIIMYLPENDEQQRAHVTESFDRYAQLVERELLPKYGAVPHWAKLEVDRMGPEVARQRLAERFPVERFNAARTELDPKNILSNKMLDAALPRD